MKGISKASGLLILVLALAGWSLLIRIPFTEEPTRLEQVLIISTAYPGATSMEVEEKITTPLEGRLGLIAEIKNIRSCSSPGYSEIEVFLASEADLVIAERKIRMMCRLESRTFPNDAGMTSVAFQGSEAPLPAMTLNIITALSQDSLHRWLSPRLVMKIGSLPESERIDYPDLCEARMEIGLNRNRIATAGITPDNIRNCIEAAAEERSLVSNSEILPPIRWAMIRHSSTYLDSIIVQNQAGNFFRLSPFIQHKDTPRCERKRWRDGKAMFGVALFFHPQGWTSQNYEQILEALHKLELEAEGAIGVEVIADNLGERLRSSRRILTQCGLSAGILAMLLFFTFGRREAIFLLLLLSGSLGLSFLGLYVLGLSLSISVIGGLTLGLGMAADNGIMVVNRHASGNRYRQFLPLLAATLTTLVPLLLVQWSNSPIITTMLGFGTALSMMLGASLVVCFVVLPVAGYSRLLPKPLFQEERIASKILSRIRRDKRWIQVGLILLIGIPVPELPERLYIGDQKMAEWYRNSVGSYEFQQIWQPRILDWIGGVSRPFFQQVLRGESSAKEENREIELILNGTADVGTYPDQMCEIAARIEQQLIWQKVSGVRISRSCGPEAECMVTVHVSRAESDLRQAEEIFRWLVSRAKKTSGITWSLSGVGKGWSNKKIPDQPWYITLQGHQYLQLLKIANDLSDSLRTIPGVIKSYVGQPQSENPIISYQLDVQALGSRNPAVFLQEVRGQGRKTGQMASPRTGQQQLIPFEMVWSPQLTLSSFLMSPTVSQSDPSPRSRFLVLDTLLNSPEIYKENQSYEVQVNWMYVGSVKMGERLEKRIRERVRNTPLPGGKLKPKNSDFVWELPFLSALIWLIPVLAIIFVISAFFLESLGYAMVVLLTIPLGWVGAMICIIITNGSLDAGSVAGFFLVTGLTVNHTIFLLMPLRTMRNPTSADIVSLYRRKMRPILLTMVSTVLTFGPFCVMPGQDVFWAHLAFITISGLFTGVLLTLACLPAFPGILSRPS